VLGDWQGQKYSGNPLTFLWNMSIPGTHDSSSRTNHTAYDDKCQTWSITEQLDNGIRFLDLRLNYNNNDNRDSNGITGFDIYHGGFQYATFKPAWYGVTDPARSDTANVYAEMVAWIDAHPSEFVVVCVANTGGTSSGEYTDEFWKVITSDGPGTQVATPSRWYFSADKSVLTYGNLKGKFVLIRSHPDWLWQRTAAPAENFGLPWEGYNFSDFHEDGYFYSQNLWSDVSYDDKMGDIRKLYAMLQKADLNKQLTYMNWISRGFNGVHGPEYYADAYNPFLSTLIDNMKAAGSTPLPTPVPQPVHLGLTIMDFPTPELIEKIVNYQ
jgi:hypothetical protein